MNSQRFLHQVLEASVVVVFLVSCAAPTSSSTLPPTFSPPQTPTFLPPPPPAVLSTQTPPQPTQQTGHPSLLRFIRTVEVAPNTQFINGAFARVNYVPGTDHLVVTFAGRLSQPAGECQTSGHGYVEFTLDMDPTGKSGVINCGMADMAGVMNGDTYYDVSMYAEEGKVGWRIMKFNVVNWERQKDIFYPLQYPYEKDGDPMAAFVNGRLDVSSCYNESDSFPAPDQGAGTFHQFFTDNLDFLEKRILTDTPHVNGSSLIYVDGVYYFLSATAFTGDIIVMKYDNDWNYLGMKVLINQAHFPTGVTYDGRRFYVAYTDTSQRTTPGFFPVYLNVHLAIFDRDWNLLEDIAVTDSPSSEQQLYTRAWVLLHGNRVYVSYDLEGSTGEEVAGFIPGRAFVSMYELLQDVP